MSSHTIQLVSGSSSTKFTYPNIFTLSLPSTGFVTSNSDEIALKSLVIYYSWPNISAALGNNSFSYSFQSVNYNVVLGDGIYSFSDIEAFLVQVMVQNGHYLIDQNGAMQMFITLIVNPCLYCLSLSCIAVPSALPAGWSNPAALDLAGNAGNCFQLNIPDKMTFLTGFAAGSYPAAPQTTLYQVNSGIPMITNVTGLNAISNVVNSSSYSCQPNVLASFVVPNSQMPGSQIQYTPIVLDYMPMQKQQTFTTITVAIVDQLMQPVVVRDPSGFLAILNIRRRN